jgi:hypothetical protein
MQLTRRLKLRAGVATAVLALVIGAVAVLASGAGGRDGDGRAAAADEDRPERDEPQRTTTTSMTPPTASTTTTTATVAPASTAILASDRNGDDDAPPPSPPPPLPPTPPPLPPLPPAPPPTPWVDTRPEAIDYSASCRTAGPTSVVGTARIVWSDGFVDEFSATFASPGYNQTVDGGQRGWWLTLNVVAPPDGTIGDYTCSNASTGGPLRWDG